MSNGSEACCALGICCPPAQRKIALVKILCDDGCPDDAAQIAAEAILNRFVLAPQSFGAVVTDIVEHFKHHGPAGV